MVVASEGKPEGESEGRLVVGVHRETERPRMQRESEKERRMDEETEVEEDNIDPLVAPPLLAQPTPSLYYPPSLRLRFPTYAHTYDLSKFAKPSGSRACSQREFIRKLGNIEEHFFHLVLFGFSSLFRQFLNIYAVISLSCRFLLASKGMRSDSRSINQGEFVADFPKILRGLERTQKRHFIKNKFREGADGYPGASWGFDAADSLPHSLSHSIFSCLARCSLLSTYAHLSIIRCTFLVCLSVHVLSLQCSPFLFSAFIVSRVV